MPTDLQSPPPPPTTTAASPDNLPWWWWIAVAAGASFLAIVLLSVCICCCHRQKKSRRNRRVLDDTAAEASAKTTDTEDNVYLRRMDSVSAKQYLHSMVCSVYSWGSDFDVATEGGGTSAAGGRGVSTAVYDNLDSLKQARANAPPPRPPVKRRNSGNHYLNVSDQVQHRR